MRLGRAGLIQSNLQAGVGYWVVSRGSRGGGCPSLHGKVLLTTSEHRLGASDLLLCPVPSLRDLPGPRVPDAQGEGLRLDQPKGVCVYMCVHTHMCTILPHLTCRSGDSAPLSVSRDRYFKALLMKPRGCTHPVAQRG